MNERMSDLLELAADDGGSPLGFSGDTVVRRARTQRRRRHGGIAAGLAAAAVAGVLVVTQLVGSSRPESRGPAHGLTTAPSRPSASVIPTATPEEQAVTDQCASLHLPVPPVSAPTGPDGLPRRVKGTRIQDTSEAGPVATFLRNWTVDAYVRDAHGLTATFVNPAHTRWASCNVGGRGVEDVNDLWTGPLPTGPVPKSWYGPDGFRHQGNTVAWSQVCSPGEGKVCGHELFAGTLVRYAGVASVVVDAPDGTVLHPVLGRYTYVFRHTEQRVDPNRPPGDMQTLPSMPVTLLDGQGHRIIRYDYFPSYLVPATCPPTGGC